jgi:hypothetical protein
MFLDQVMNEKRISGCISTKNFQIEKYLPKKKMSNI